MSDKINQLAKEMRERALLITANPELTHELLEGRQLQIEKRNQLEREKKIKKLYFHAGRWSAGSRDHTAREAFMEYNRRETHANNNN